MEYFKVNTPGQPEVDNFIQQTGFVGVRCALFVNETYIYSNDEQLLIVDENNIHLLVNSKPITVPIQKTDINRGDMILFTILVFYSAQDIRVALKEPDGNIYLYEFDGVGQTFTDADIELGVDSFGEGHSDSYIRHIESGTTTNFNDTELLTKFRQLEL